MRNRPSRPESEAAPIPRAHAIHRTVNGREQIVVVCAGGCDAIEVIEVQDAMRHALQAFLKDHENSPEHISSLANAL